MKTGIESISMYVPRYWLDLADLARARGVDPAKYRQGIGQEQMAVPAPDEDVVTLAANAARQALEDVDRSDVRTVIFATESGIDQSKAAAIYVHKLLGLPSNCRTVEMKQACCSSTSALHFGMATVAQRPDQKVLVVASDIARYGLGSPGEPTQGAGAVAMVLSARPRVLAVDPACGYFTEDVMDFWRPNYLEEALVDGKYSIKVYLHALEQAWADYREASGATWEEFHRFCYHLPFSRMGIKAHQHLARLNGSILPIEQLETQVENGVRYHRRIGNGYTASLYMGLLSLLDCPKENLDGRRIGLFSYGSGCMGAFFGGTVLPGYRDALRSGLHQDLLDQRQRLDVAQYEAFYRHSLPSDGSHYRTARHATGEYRLAGVEDHKRLYEQVPAAQGLGLAARPQAAAPMP